MDCYRNCFSSIYHVFGYGANISALFHELLPTQHSIQKSNQRTADRVKKSTKTEIEQKSNINGTRTWIKYPLIAEHSINQSKRHATLAFRLWNHVHKSYLKFIASPECELGLNTQFKSIQCHRKTDTFISTQTRAHTHTHHHHHNP